MREIRTTFEKAQPDLPLEKLYFLDESGVKIGMARTHARAPRGTRAEDRQPKKKGENFTLIGAMGLVGIVATTVLRGGMTKPDFINFMRDELLPRLPRGAIVVLDNLRSHHAKEVVELATAHGVRLVFIPPYSPEYNPIEKAWSKLKAWLRKMRARTLATLMTAIESGVERITQQDVLGWSKHSGYETP